MNWDFLPLQNLVQKPERWPKWPIGHFMGSCLMFLRIASWQLTVPPFLDLFLAITVNICGHPRATKNSIRWRILEKYGQKIWGHLTCSGTKFWFVSLWDRAGGPSRFCVSAWGSDSCEIPFPTQASGIWRKILSSVVFCIFDSSVCNASNFVFLYFPPNTWCKSVCPAVSVRWPR